MKQLRFTLMISCLLIGVGILIILQAPHVKWAFGPEVEGQFSPEDGLSPSIADTRPALPEDQTKIIQTNLVAAENIESSTLITRKTSLVFSNNHRQARLTGEVHADTRRDGEEVIVPGFGGNPVINQNSKKNEPVKSTLDSVPWVNHASGESTEDKSEPPTALEPVRLSAPVVEVEASDWLEYGNESAEREDPVPLIWPAEERWLSGYNFSNAHPGIDIAATFDDLIFAAASGKIIAVQHSNYGYGKMVMINHLNGYQTLYAHLNTILVEMDDFVIQGQPIGLAGSTGNSTGTHLHFEIHSHGRFVNPWLFLTR